MNLNMFTYFVILIWIKPIYSQICVNFKILGKNEEERTKGLKRENWNASTVTQARLNSLEREAPRGSRPSKPNLTQARSL